MTPPTRLMERLREDFEDRHSWLRRIEPLVKQMNEDARKENNNGRG